MSNDVLRIPALALPLVLALTACAAGPDPAAPGSGPAALHDHETYPLPSDLAARRGHEATLVGYMVPLRFDDSDGVVEFMLTSRPVACCETSPPRPDEWVHVAMSDGHAAPFVGADPVTVCGTLLAVPPADVAAAGGLHALEAIDVAPR